MPASTRVFNKVKFNLWSEGDQKAICKEVAKNIRKNYETKARVVPYKSYLTETDQEITLYALYVEAPPPQPFFCG